MTPEQQINKLFVLANLQENIILQMPNGHFKQMAKLHFNRVIAEIKRLNQFVNSHLDDQEIEGIDELTRDIEETFNKYI